MDALIGRYSAHIYALLRIVAGLLFLMHGTQKLFGVPGDRDPVTLLSMMGLAGLIEFVAGLMILVGFLTSWAAILASGEMAFAYFMAHAGRALWPIQNQGELAVLYCFLFLYIASMGAGVWSMDRALRGGARV